MPLEWTHLPEREPGRGQLRIKVGACGVRRTDLHVVDGELPHPQVLVSVANLTRQDGVDFFAALAKMGIVTRTTADALHDANQALADLRAGTFEGAAVLLP